MWGKVTCLTLNKPGNSDFKEVCSRTMKIGMKIVFVIRGASSRTGPICINTTSAAALTASSEPENETKWAGATNEVQSDENGLARCRCCSLALYWLYIRSLCTSGHFLFLSESFSSSQYSCFKCFHWFQTSLHDLTDCCNQWTQCQNHMDPSTTAASVSVSVTAGRVFLPSTKRQLSKVRN